LGTLAGNCDIPREPLARRQMLAREVRCCRLPWAPLPPLRSAVGIPRERVRARGHVCDSLTLSQGGYNGKPILMIKPWSCVSSGRDSSSDGCYYRKKKQEHTHYILRLDFAYFTLRGELRKIFSWAFYPFPIQAAPHQVETPPARFDWMKFARTTP